jgi:hypothetical protein
MKRLSYHSFIETSRIPSPISDRLKGTTLPRRAELMDKNRHIEACDLSICKKKYFLDNRR